MAIVCGLDDIDAKGTFGMVREKRIERDGQEGWEQWYRELLKIDRDPPEKSSAELNRDLEYWQNIEVFEKHRYAPKKCETCGQNVGEPI